MTTAHETQKERAVETHSDQANLFDERYRDFGRDPYSSCFLYSRHCLDRFLDRLLPAPPTGQRLLDVGCGTGYHLAWARARGFAVTGVDGSAEMLERAARLNPGIELQKADVESLPFEDGSFDAVVCIEVLRYLPDSQRCIGEMARVLRPGGACFVTAAPLFNVSGYPLINRIAAALPLGNLVRLRQFFHTSLRLRREFRRAGFRRTSVHGVYMGPINWVERLAPRLLSPLLRAWEPIDRRVVDWPVVRDLSGMLLVHAER
jgi:ubiquinone/menaquinone biosynthesis C-methylase UbiE